MNKLRTIWAWSIIAFLILRISDIAYTILIHKKHLYFNESNILWLIGIPFWLFILVNIILSLSMVWIMVEYYPKNKSIISRFLLVYFFVLFIILNLGIVISNQEVYNMPVEEVQPIPEPERVQFYKEQIYDMQVISNIAPKARLPMIIPFFIINMVQFITWRSFEEHGR